MDIGTIIKTEKKNYVLRFDNRAYRLAEKISGKALTSLKDGINDLSTLLLAGLSGKHPETTIETVDEIIDEIGYEEISEILGEAIKQSPPLQKRISRELNEISS